MSETAFALTPKVTLGVRGTRELDNYYFEKFGVASWKEESAAADAAIEARDRVLEQAGLLIQRLYQQTGNLAMVGEKLCVFLPDEACPGLQVAWREPTNSPDDDHIVLFYFLGLNQGRLM